MTVSSVPPNALPRANSFAHATLCRAVSLTILALILPLAPLMLPHTPSAPLTAQLIPHSQSGSHNNTQPQPQPHVNIAANASNDDHIDTPPIPTHTSLHPLSRHLLTLIATHSLHTILHTPCTPASAVTLVHPLLLTLSNGKIDHSGLLDSDTQPIPSPHPKRRILRHICAHPSAHTLSTARLYLARLVTPAARPAATAVSCKTQTVFLHANVTVASTATIATATVTTAATAATNTPIPGSIHSTACLLLAPADKTFFTTDTPRHSHTLATLDLAYSIGARFAVASVPTSTFGKPNMINNTGDTDATTEQHNDDLDANRADDHIDKDLGQSMVALLSTPHRLVGIVADPPAEIHWLTYRLSYN